MLGEKYLKVNGQVLPRPKAHDITNKPNEKIGTSDSGKDIIIPKRLKKRNYKFTFQVTSRWLGILQSYGEEATVVLSYNGEEITGRWRPGKAAFVEGSEFVQGTDGLYILAVDFYEM